MLRTLRARLTFSYVIFVLAVFTIVALVLGREALALFARSQNDSMDRAVFRINALAERDRGQSFSTLAATVHRDVDRPGLRIIGVAKPRGLQFPAQSTHVKGVYVQVPSVSLDGKSPPSVAMRGVIFRPDEQHSLADRAVFFIAQIGGLHQRQVILTQGIFFVRFDMDQLRSAVTTYLLVVLVLLVVVGVLAWLLGNYLAGRALAPMAAVTGALRRFAAGDFSPQRVDTRDVSEVGELARAFNGAAQQVDAAFEERQRAQQHIRQFVADASHELRTPLTVIVGYLELLKRGALEDPGRRERAFATIDIESHRMRILIEKLIVLARLERPQSSELNRVDLSSVVRNAATEIEAIAGHPAVRLALDDGAVVMAEEAELHEALTNLLDNARKYGDGMPIDVEVKRSDGMVTARVIDAGPGIEPEEQPHVFERFYRGATRGEIEGSGLGLAIAQQAVMRAHGKLLLAESRPGRTVFEVRLPSAPPSESPTPPATELVLR